MGNYELDLVESYNLLPDTLQEVAKPNLYYIKIDRFICHCGGTASSENDTEMLSLCSSFSV